MININESVYSYYKDADEFEAKLTCTFCSQFKYKDDKNIANMIFGEYFNRILYEDNNFVVVPALGQITEGYLLIISKDHFDSIAKFPQNLHNSFLKLKNKVSKIISKEYSSPIFFEHGTYSPSQLGGASINHAHIHAVPINVNLKNTELKKLNLIPVDGIHDLWNFKIDKPYIYFETLQNEAFFISLESKFPFQYLRRIIANEIGNPQIWNWRDYIGVQEVKNTMKKLSDKF